MTRGRLEHSLRTRPYDLAPTLLRRGGASFALGLTVTTKRRSSSAKKAPAPVASGWWMALLASTTLGLEGANTVRADVQADEDLAESRDYRLVVQSFDAGEGKHPNPGARPVGSYQRSVTAAELRSGVRVHLVELRKSATGPSEGAVVAWIEAGKPDLEFDGRT